MSDFAEDLIALALFILGWARFFAPLGCRNCKECRRNLAEIMQWVGM